MVEVLDRVNQKVEPVNATKQIPLYKLADVQLLAMAPILAMAPTQELYESFLVGRRRSIASLVSALITNHKIGSEHIVIDSGTKIGSLNIEALRATDYFQKRQSMLEVLEGYHFSKRSRRYKEALATQQTETAAAISEAEHILKEAQPTSQLNPVYAVLEAEGILRRNRKELIRRGFHHEIDFLRDPELLQKNSRPRSFLLVSLIRQGIIRQSDVFADGSFDIESLSKCLYFQTHSHVLDFLKNYHLTEASKLRQKAIELDHTRPEPETTTETPNQEAQAAVAESEQPILQLNPTDAVLKKAQRSGTISFRANLRKAGLSVAMASLLLFSSAVSALAQTIPTLPLPPTATATESPTRIPTPTPTEKPTDTATASATATRTPTPTGTATASATKTERPTDTATASATATRTATITALATAIATAIATAQPEEKPPVPTVKPLPVPTAKPPQATASPRPAASPAPQPSATKAAEVLIPLPTPKTAEEVRLVERASNIQGMPAELSNVIATLILTSPSAAGVVITTVEQFQSFTNTPPSAKVIVEVLGRANTEIADLAAKGEATSQKINHIINYAVTEAALKQDDRFNILSPALGNAMIGLGIEGIKEGEKVDEETRETVEEIFFVIDQFRQRTGVEIGQQQLVDLMGAYLTNVAGVTDPILRRVFLEQTAFSFSEAFQNSSS